MKAAMDDLLTGWPVNDRRPGMHGNGGNRSPLPNRQELRSAGSNTGAGLGRARLYGWHPSHTYPDESRERGRAAGPRSGASALRVKEENRQLLQMYSPYFFPVRPTVARGRPGSRHSSSAASGSAPRRSCHASAGTSRRSRLVAREQTASAPLPKALRPVQSAGGVGSRAVTPPRKMSEHLPHSPGGAFFHSLAHASQQCGGNGIVLPVVRCQSNSGVINLAPDAHPRNGNVYGGGAIVHPSGSVNLMSSCRSSSQETSSVSPASDPAVVPPRQLMEWEAACVMETSASQRCVAVAKKMEQLKSQVNEADGALEAVKMRQVSLKEKMRSFADLQLEVGREEKKSRELRRIAQLAMRRVDSAQSLEAKNGLHGDAASDPGDCVGGEPMSMASLLHQRDTLQLERAALRQAVHAAAAESRERSTSGAPNSRVSTRLHEAERRRLEQTVAILQDRERRLKARARLSGLRADRMMGQVEELRATMRQKKVQGLRKVVESSDTASFPGSLQDVTTTTNPVGSCFITELEA
ncbi:uncharacterized protein Tco025E_01866 [Trypanosoma conorhini]|uniref:Uncharacterized protein n=1 Tax=Trypanosoma conorhini TaxID=83891 RepID=A0A422Q7C8_9TRYP|nr:uncharacterized protein Tco025E_01866 [Trypanosoma conorhini]RNF25861.1 hypothetical protein Tco025E_01866 [Trypanosoma conorhini]